MIVMFRNNLSEVFLGKGVLKICNKLTEEHPCRSVISIKLICNFIEIWFRQGCFHNTYSQNTFCKEHLWRGYLYIFGVLAEASHCTIPKLFFTHVVHVSIKGYPYKHWDFCGFGHIYWRILLWKTSFFVQ